MKGGALSYQNQQNQREVQPAQLRPQRPLLPQGTGVQPQLRPPIFPLPRLLPPQTAVRSAAPAVASSPNRIAACGKSPRGVFLTLGQVEDAEICVVDCEGAGGSKVVGGVLKLGHGQRGPRRPQTPQVAAKAAALRGLILEGQAQANQSHRSLPHGRHAKCSGDEEREDRSRIAGGPCLCRRP